MKSFVLIILLTLSFQAFSSSANTQKLLEKIYITYEQGEYTQALKLLDKISLNFENHQKAKNDLKGFISYWQGLCHLRLNEFEEGIDKLRIAIKENHKASDLYYEYGQALYASLKLKKARLAFKKSVEARYKMAVSMYYIGFISQELGDLKTAASFYNAIEKLPLDEKKEVVQAARMQLAQIYMDQIKKKGMGAAAVEEYVLPLYKKALQWDEDSPLAKEIKGKIEKIQRRYDLILFKLRNGRPTARPPYFLKTSLKYSYDDNVNAIDNDSKEALDKKEYSAAIANVGAFGRYTFYPNSAFSLTPQFNFGYSKYLSDESIVTQNDNYYFTTSLQTTFEHFFKEAPATTYFDIDYTYNANDSDQDKSIEKSDTVLSFTISEQLNIWANNPSTFRLKYTQTNAEELANERSSIGAVYEQAVLAFNSIFYLYSSYEQFKYEEETSEDNTGITLRLDALMPDFYGLFNPNLYASTYLADYTNDADRGTTTLNTYGININRPLGKNLFIYFDYALSEQTGDSANDNYEKQVFSINLDYIF